MKIFNIGIDTGGTYTDAVIVDAHTHEVIAAAKALTTRGSLEIGVSNALGAVMQAADKRVGADQVVLVSLSTTLATNALVEGMGSTVAAVLIGFSDDMVKRSNLAKAIPGVQIVRINGGHNYDGSEICKLDEANLIQKITTITGGVEAFAVAANYSIRNPAHEQRTKQLVEELTGRPVTASSELSDGLNVPLRALTATFNVRIVSLIINLVDSVRGSMRQYNIEAPLMIVKGDGSIARADSVIDKPIETILSGPAASVIGANFISNLKDFIISDVGGTTTDVAIVRNGWPSLNEKGAIAGGYRTLVRAIDMQTIGLGGDSEVEANYKGEIRLKSNRVVPISLICNRFPAVVDSLRASLGDGMGLERAIRFIFLPEGFDKQNMPAGLSEADLRFLDQISTEPGSFERIVVRASDRARVERLLDRGIVQVCAVTPSDAAHVLGLQSQWSTEGARLACLMLGRSHGLISWLDDNIEQDIKHFAQRIFNAMVGKSAWLVINQLSGHQFPSGDPLISAVTQGGNHLNDLAVQLKSVIPLVAVGGPAQVFYPAVGERLNVQTVIPPNADVANAIGAAIGRIKIHKLIEITSAESGGYHLHHDGEPIFIASSEEALEQARNLASTYLQKKAKSMGGGLAEIDIQIDRVDLPNMDPASSLVSATVIAECLSSPAV
jgi:N-methylhydantoinase A/oxoprolinase/acetone carboxylase beta subunit